MRRAALFVGVLVLVAFMVGAASGVARADQPPLDLAGQPFYFSATCTSLGDVILVNQSLARRRQFLALDTPFKGATIGGTIATNDSGSLRHRYGTPRDLLIGVHLATTDGRSYRSVASLQVPVRYPAVAAVAGKLYVFGGEAITGRQSGRPLTDIQEVDPTATSCFRRVASRWR